MEKDHLIQNGSFYLQGFNGWGERDEATPMARPDAIKKCAWLLKQGNPNVKAVPLLEPPRVYPSRKRVRPAPVPAKRELLVRHVKTLEIVRCIDVHDKSDSMIRKVVSGLLRNISDDYFVDDSFTESKLVTTNDRT